MSVARKFRLLTFATFGVVVCLALLIALTVWAEASLNSTQTARQESYRLAVLLRQTSDDLTRLVRAYVVTGNPEREREYNQLDARQSGREPWPDGRRISIREMMQQAGMTAAELAKLNDSDKESNALVAVETAAFHAMKGEFADGAGGFSRKGSPNRELALKLVHDEAYERSRETINEPIRAFERMLDQRTREAVDAAVVRSRVCLALTGLLVLCTALLVFGTLRSISRMLRRTADQLERGAQELSSAASQVSAASQTLAQGSSEQAASLQETSAAAEQVRAVAQANAEHANSAAVLAQESERIGRAVDTDFDALSGSMQEIAESGRRISQITRTVDEIAFQTNILALNAAVEAARAGDAGMGFAVVADEVRNLAQRAAEAAKQTTSLIEQALGATESGKKNLDNMMTTLRASRGNGEQIARLVVEVSNGSRQQADGVDGIAKAVQQMDTVTQSTASTAEEAAASGEEMNSQADAVLRLARDLRAAVGGAA